MIVSKHWLKIRQEILTDIEDALIDSQDLQEIINELIPMVITMSINRSSCYMCNAFLVSELISLWKEIAILLRGQYSWTEIRDALKDIYRFEVTYSVEYSAVSDVEALNEQLGLAGWYVNAHEETERSDDEREHEQLSMGNVVSSEVKQKQKRKSGKSSKKDADSDYEESDEEESQLVITYRFTREMSRYIKLEAALKEFFKRMVKNQASQDPIVTLQALGFTHHGMDGTDLDCALYSIQHQLALRHNIIIADFKEFATFVRKLANLNFGTMIDVLNNGGALLNAVVAYLVNKGLVAANTALVLNVWSAVAGGGLMEFNNVATSARAARTLSLILYYNGVNHFDSLEGDPID